MCRGRPPAMGKPAAPRAADPCPADRGSRPRQPGRARLRGREPRPTRPEGTTMRPGATGETGESGGTRTPNVRERRAPRAWWRWSGGWRGIPPDRIACRSRLVVDLSWAVRRCPAWGMPDGGRAQPPRRASSVRARAMAAVSPSQNLWGLSPASSWSHVGAWHPANHVLTALPRPAEPGGATGAGWGARPVVLVTVLRCGDGGPRTGYSAGNEDIKSNSPPAAYYYAISFTERRECSAGRVQQ